MTAQVEYCERAELASDKAICADHQLGLMQDYALSGQRLATSNGLAVKTAIDAVNFESLKKRAACNGDTNCWYDVPDEQINALVQHW